MEEKEKLPARFYRDCEEQTGAERPVLSRKRSWRKLCKGLSYRYG